MSDLEQRPTGPGAGSRAAADAVTRPVAPASAPAVDHEVSLVDHRRFTQPVCTCGWVGAGRRSRRLAHEEARDHALLYAAPDPRPAG